MCAYIEQETIQLTWIYIAAAGSASGGSVAGTDDAAVTIDATGAAAGASTSSLLI